MARSVEHKNALLIQHWGLNVKGQGFALPRKQTPSITAHQLTVTTHVRKISEINPPRSSSHCAFIILFDILRYSLYHHSPTIALHCSALLCIALHCSVPVCLDESSGARCLHPSHQCIRIQPEEAGVMTGLNFPPGQKVKLCRKSLNHHGCCTASAAVLVQQRLQALCFGRNLATDGVVTKGAARHHHQQHDL